MGGVSVASRPVDRSVGPVSAGGVSVAAPPIDLSAGPISMGGVRVAPCPIDLSAGIVCTGFVRALRVVDLDPGTFEVDVAPPVTLPGTSLAENSCTEPRAASPVFDGKASCSARFCVREKAGSTVATTERGSSVSNGGGKAALAE